MILKKNMHIMLILVLIIIGVVPFISSDIYAAAGSVVNQATGVEYSRLDEAFKYLQEGEASTLIINGSVQAAWSSGAAAVVPNNCDITILAGEDTPTIKGSIQLPINSTSMLTIGNGDTSKTLMINGVISALGGKLTTNSEISVENDGMALVVGYVYNGYPVEASINGGTFKSTGLDAAVVARFDGAYISNITGATIVNSADTSTYEGALTVTNGARVGEVKDSNFEARYKSGIDVTWGGKIDKISGVNIVQNGYGTYKQGVGITCRMGTSSTETRIGTIENTTITANVQGQLTSEPYGSYASGIQVGYGSGGKCIIDKIENCTITSTATSPVYGAVQVLGSTTADVAAINTIKNCTIESTKGGSGVLVQNARIGTLEDNTVSVNTVSTSGAGDGIWVRGKSTIESIKGGTYTSYGSGNGRGLMLTELQNGGLNPTVSSISNTIFEGYTSGIYLSASTDSCTIGSITGDVTADEYKTGIIGRNGPALHNIAGSVGKISGVEIKSNGTNSSACGVNNTCLIYGDETLRGQIGTIENSRVEGFAGIKNEGGQISSVNGSVLKANGKTVYGDAVYNRDFKNSLSGTVTPATIEEIKDCVLGGYYGIFNWQENEADEVSKIELSEECDIQAEYIGIYNRNGTISKMKDTDITADAESESSQRIAVLNYTAASTIGSITGGTISAPSGTAAYGILNNGSIGEIESSVIAALTRGVNTQSSSSIGTLKNATVSAETDMALNVASGSNVETIDGGRYTGGTHAINLKDGSLGTITGDAVFYGKNGYAINNTEETDGKQISIEPSLSKEVKGYARYYGSEGVTNNNHIAMTDKDIYPVHELGQTYSMSTRTEQVPGISGVDFHYLTVNVKVRYDGNGGTGDMSDKGYDGEWTDALQAESCDFTREEYLFTSWNTRADGTGDSYQSGDTIDIKEAETTLYAQWSKYGKIQVTFKIANPAYRINTDQGAVYYRDAQSPFYTSLPWLLQSYSNNGAASLKDSTGKIVDSFSDQSSYTFENLQPGEYDIELDVLNNPNLCLNAGVHNGSPRSELIIWREDSEKLHITVPKNSTEVIQRWVLLDLKAFGFKTKTDVGTFASNPADSGIPGEPSSDGKEYIYYDIREDGNNWNHENPDTETSSYMPYVHQHLGILYGEKASQYKGMTALQVPALSAEEEAQGYIFKGWKLEGDDSGKVYTEDEALKYTVRAHTSFSAVWGINTYTVTFDSNGGTDVDHQIVSHGDKATKPEDPTKEGFVFKEWQLNGVSYNFEAPVTEDITLKAIWEKDGDDDRPSVPDPLKKYTITYKLNGGKYNGSEDDIQEVYDDGTVISIHEAPIRDGYTFLYWEGSKHLPGDEFLVTEDHTFTAQWKKIANTEEQDDSGNTDNPGKDDNPGNTKNPGKSVELGKKARSAKPAATGDETELAGMIALMIASAVILVVIVYRRKHG